MSRGRQHILLYLGNFHFKHATKEERREFYEEDWWEGEARPLTKLEGTQERTQGEDCEVTDAPHNSSREGNSHDS